MQGKQERKMVTKRRKEKKEEEKEKEELSRFVYLPSEAKTAAIIVTKRRKEKKEKKELDRFIYLPSAAKTATMVLVHAHGAAHVEATVGVNASGFGDVLEECVDAHVVRMTRVPHQVL